MPKRKKKKDEPKSFPAVSCRAIVQRNGTRETKYTTLFDQPPVWWNQSQPDQRALWIKEYFRRKLNLTPDEELLTVICEP
jgi:hypothetical protein